MDKVSEYERGIADGLRAYAHWVNGKQEVGTTGTLLSLALANIKNLHVYDPPVPSEEEERKAFEHWFSDEGKHPRAVERGADGHYLLATAASAWTIWKARAGIP